MMAVLSYPLRKNLEKQWLFPRYRILLPFVNLSQRARVKIPILGSRKALQQSHIESPLKLQCYVLSRQGLMRKH